MKVLITGASSGMGRDMAKYLSGQGHELILVARDKAKLEELQQTLKTRTTIIVMDLTVMSNVKSLYVVCKNENIDVLINNAGFGLWGKFSETDNTKDLEMIDLNIKALYMLTKMFLKDMKRRNHGYILNVASMASFYPGPLMANYYATKAYVLRLTEGIAYELKKEKSNVVISCLCPGPVDTHFSATAGVHFAVKPLKSEKVARYALDQLLRKKKLVIIPGFKMKCVHFFSRFLSDKMLMRFCYRIQKKKME